MEYVVSSEGKKVFGSIKITYTNGKSKVMEVTDEGIVVVKSTVSSVEVVSAR